MPMVESHDMIYTSPFATILYHPCQFYHWTGNQTGMNIKNTILILLNAIEPLRKFVLEIMTVLVLFQSCSRTVVQDS